MRLQNKITLSALAGASLIGSLAGCTTSATTSTSDSSSASPTSNSSGTSTGTVSKIFKDGTYTKDGTYQSPAGTGRITVKLTLASGVITAVDVNGHATDPTAKTYQAEFDSGIAGKVVGKKIDSLNVTNVSGSSLTSGGFDEAIKAIEASASA